MNTTCVWQSITNVIDGYYLILFGVTIVGIFAMATVGMLAHRQIKKRAKPSKPKSGWFRRLFTDADDDEGLSDRELRNTSYAWFVSVRRALIVVVLFTLLYPLLSPTFCLNVKCKEPISAFQPDPACGAAAPDR